MGYLKLYILHFEFRRLFISEKSVLNIYFLVLNPWISKMTPDNKI